MNESSPEQLFDLSYLNQVFQGNKSMIDSIISLFLQQVPQYVTEMEQCVESGELRSLHPLAHKAKSSVAMLGLKEMEEHILLIERKSKEAMELDQLPTLVNQVRAQCEKASQQLAALV